MIFKDNKIVGFGSPSECSLVEIEVALADFGVEAATIAPVTSGSPNQNWLIETDSGKFVLKRFPYSMPESWVEFQVRALDMLADQSSAVTAVEKTQAGRGFAAGAQCSWQLREYVPGEHLTLGRRPQVLAAMGFLQLLHSVCGPEFDGNSPTDRISTWLDDPTATLKDSLRFLQQCLSVAEYSALSSRYWRQLECATDIFDNQVYASLSSSLSHGEYVGNNLVFNGDRLLTVLDWDSLQIRPKVYDLAVGMLFLCRRARGAADLNISLAIDFVDEYCRGSDLSKDELLYMEKILLLYFLPLETHLLRLRDQSSEKLRWYLDWSGRCVETVSAQVRAVTKAVCRAV